MSQRLDKALQRWWLQTEERRWIFGLVGRVNSDGTVTVNVAERPDFVYVRMNSNGETQTLTIARNQGRVPLRAGLPVKMKREAGVLVIEDVDRSGLLEDDANAPGTVYSVNGATGDVVLDSDDITEGAANLYMTTAERSKLAGVAAGAEVNVNADWSAVSGDAQILNKPTIPTVDAASVGAAIDGTTEATSFADANKFALIVSGALKWISGANLKATLKTYFDTLYTAISTAVLLTGAQTVAGVKTWSSNAIFNALVGIGTASPNYKLTVVGDGAAPESSAVLTSQTGVIAVFGDGHAYLMTRDATNDIEGLMGTSTVGAVFFGAMTAHDLQLRTANVTRMTVKDSTGNVGIGTDNPQGKTHIHDGTGGFMFVSKTGIVGSAQTLIPGGTGDVTKQVTFYGISSSSLPESNLTSVTVTPGSNSDTSYSGGTLRFSVSAGGAFTVTRLSGASTFSISGIVIWQ